MAQVQTDEQRFFGNATRQKYNCNRQSHTPKHRGVSHSKIWRSTQEQRQQQSNDRYDCYSEGDSFDDSDPQLHRQSTNSKKLTCPKKDALIQRLDFEGTPVKLVSDSHSCAVVLKELIAMHPEAVGIDCEQKAIFSRGQKENKISLLQIASDSVIILIRMHKLRHFPSELTTFLGDRHVLKVGVGIYGDCDKLRRDYLLVMRGCVELNHIFQALPIERKDDNLVSLKRLSEMFIGREKMSKSTYKKITLSNWEAPQLSAKQISYAARDAMDGFEILHAFAETCAFAGTFLELCDGKIDHNPKRKRKPKKKQQGKGQKTQNETQKSVRYKFVAKNGK